MRLAELALADSTQLGYGYAWSRFQEYCDSEGLSSLPASRLTVFMYIGHLAEQGTIASGSLQPTLSAINGAHRDVGLEPPAVGSHFLTLARRGLGRAQAALSTRDSRVPLPAFHMEQILDAGLALVCNVTASREVRRAYAARLREHFALSLGSLFSGRSDSTVHLRVADFGVDSAFMWIRLSEKGKRHLVVRRVVRLPLRTEPVHGEQSALPRVASLASRYLRARTEVWDQVGSQGTAWLFQLPGEARPTSRSMGTWFAAVMERLHIVAPEGFAYLPHSQRSGAVSAEAAIGVPRHIYTWKGGWARSSPVVERDYIDPTVLPSPSAYRLFGWLLARQYEVGDAVVERQQLLPDPRLEDVDEGDPAAADE